MVSTEPGVRFDNNKFTLDYYEAFAWGGLEGTNYFTNPPSGLTIPTNQATINGNYRNKTLGHGCK